MTTPLQHANAQASLQRKTSRARRSIPVDAIDKLDESLPGGLSGYHHEGPFDATLKSRQIKGRAPLDAVRLGNSLQRTESEATLMQPLGSLEGDEIIESARDRQLGRHSDDDEDDDDEDDEGLRSKDKGKKSRALGTVEYYPSGADNEMSVLQPVQGASAGANKTDSGGKHVEIAAAETTGSTSASDAKASSSGGGGMLSGLKKRLSVKRKD